MDVYVKYYRAICAIESRFPISATPGHVNIRFVWQDAFRPQREVEQCSLHFEKAAIIFNMASVASQEALSIDRKTSKGLLDSARKFQESAGFYEFLGEGAAKRLEEPRPIDLSPQCAEMLAKLMLAQAQECILEKAVLDGKTNAALARIAKHASDIYENCHQLLCTKPLSEHFDRTWAAHTNVKALLHQLESDIYNAADLRRKDSIKGVANEISQLRAAKLKIASAKKESKHASQELQDNVSLKELEISEKLEKSEKENATVYLQRVPQAADLPEVIPAPLSKPIAPKFLTSSNDSGDLFRGVVPESIMKSLSLYTDRVDSLVRGQVDRLESALDDVRIRLREMELPESLQYLNPNGNLAALPESFKEELKVVEERGGVKHLNELISQLHDLRSVILRMLQGVESELHAEKNEDDKMREKYGNEWKSLRSLDMTSGMMERIRGFWSNLQVAEKADKEIEQKMRTQTDTYSSLNYEDISSRLPKIQEPMFSFDDTDHSSAVASLRAALDGLSTLSSQRAALEEGFKQRRSTDDILPKLLSDNKSEDEIFETEIKKYDDLVHAVDENISKQTRLLEMIKKAHAIFLTAYDILDWKKRCVKESERIRVGIKSFIEISNNLAEGINFYSQLQDAVQSLEIQVQDYCRTRRMEREHFERSLLEVPGRSYGMASRFGDLNLSTSMAQARENEQHHWTGPPREVYSSNYTSTYSEPSRAEYSNSNANHTIDRSNVEGQSQKNPLHMI